MPRRYGCPAPEKSGESLFGRATPPYTARVGAAVARSDIRGREDELRAIGRFLDAVPGGARGLLIEGEAGIGKTTLWRAAIEEAAARDQLVLACQAVEAEVSLPFVGLADLLEPVLEGTLPALPGPQREALEAALLRAEPPAEGAGEAAISAATLNVLRAAPAPLLVAVDDVQWLDRQTARVLAFALRRLERQSFAVVASLRIGEPFSSPELERLFVTLDVEPLAIGPLSLFALDAMLRDQFSLGLPRIRLRELHRVTAGNPLYAREIARESVRTGSADVAVPRRLSELLRQRIRVASPGAKRLLLLTAELGDPKLTTLEQLDVADDVFGEVAARELALPESGHLRLTHPLLAPATRDEANELELRELHLFLSQRLEDDVERALHLARASSEPDERVATELEEAASIAEARGAQETAALLAEEAIRLTAAGGEPLWRRTIDAAYHLYRIGENAPARELLERLVEVMPGGSLRARALFVLAHVDELNGFSRAAAALQEPGIDDDLRFRLELLQAVHTMDDDLERAVELFRRAARTAAAAGNDWQRALAACYVAYGDCYLGRPIDMGELDWAVAVIERAWGGRERREFGWDPRDIRGRILSTDGHDDRARSDFEQCLARSVELGDEPAILSARALLLRVEIGAGNVGTALWHAEGVEEIARHMTAGSVVARAWGTVAWVYAWAGRVDAAREAAARALAVPTPLTETERWTRSELGLLELSLGNAEAAYTEFARAVELLRVPGYRHPGFFWFWHDAFEAYAATKRIDEAEELLAWLDQLLAALDHAPSRASAEIGRALIRSSLGDGEGAVAATEAAVEQHERFNRPLHLARTLLVRGAILRRAKQKRAAREAIAQAVSIFESCGAELWLDRARQEFERTGAHHVDRWELTPTEDQVARLAAAGAKNAEIARQLFMSVKTVEANLSRIYGKLGVRSRTELAARMR
jgi:DNA-binding CsgD family transcriptional regulator